jgi:hypothetical protein
MQNSFEYQLTVMKGAVKIEDESGNYLIRERKPWEVYDEDFLTTFIFELKQEILMQHKLKGLV